MIKKTTGWIAAIWGVMGIVGLLFFAIYRLYPYVLELRDTPNSPLQILLLCVFVLLMAYSEGFRGFQKSFSPRVVARAKYLKDSGSIKEKILAPLFCLCLMGATRKRLSISYTLIIGLWMLVYFMRFVTQPWRGIIDAGVLVGLSWGVISVIWLSVTALLGRRTISDFQ